MRSTWQETSLHTPPDGAGIPMQQHPSYAAASRALGAGSARFVLREGDRVNGMAQVLLRRWPLVGRFALLARGPVWAPGLAPDAAAAALADLVRHLSRQTAGVIVTPDRVAGRDPLAGSGCLPMVTPGHLARLALAGGPEALRAGLHQKWRNRLHRAEAAGLRTSEAPMPPDPGHWLLRAEAAQARARRYARLPPAFAAAWSAAGEARLFAAHDGRTPVAGMLFLRHGPWASYHVGWTSEAGRAVSAHALLMWQAILWGCAAGLDGLDLGTLDTVGAPGLARFKLGTGAAPVRLGATRMVAPGTRLVAALAREPEAA